MQLRFGAVLAAVMLSFGTVSEALAQPAETTYAEEPTAGVDLPATPLAGEHDARSVVVNPGGLGLLRGGHFAVAYDYADDDDATAPGPGLGFYLGSSIGGELLPRIGWGVGLELLSPSRVSLRPDPGSPTRLTLSTALALSSSTALGVAWHRFWDGDTGSTDGLRTWDVGLSTRFHSNRLAAGLVVRDLNAPTVAGAEVQRRYELELLTRPLATEALELSLGGRIGEEEGDLDGWLRGRVRLTRGVYFHGEAGMRELRVFEEAPSGMTTEREEREFLATAGIELSLGAIGATVLGTTALDDDGDARFGGGTIIARASSEQVPSVLGPRQRIERVEISGALSNRAHVGLVLRLRALGRDPAVRGVFLAIDGIGAGWAQLQELRDVIADVRKRGKRVFAYIVAGDGADYFVASAADRVYVDPAGGLRLQGFSGTIIYFKGLFDKLGVSAQFEKIAEYKSAPEAYTRTSPTEPALRMRNELYDSLYTDFVDGIAHSRGLTREQVLTIMNEGPYTAGDLQGDDRLVDAIVTPDEISKLIVQELGAYPVASAASERPERWEYPSIAVIHIEGDIVDGKSQTIPLLGRKVAGGETISRAIAQARANPQVAAVVLRIDSPGGSALASELISREVFKTRGVKPIICSMGDVAASGGYFAAAGCDVVFAEPMTITGSIGIFYGKFDLSGLLTRLGVAWTVYKRGENSDTDSYFRPYTEEERAMLQEKMRYLYGRFTEAVARGRGMTQERVDELGRGRVWSGVAAKRVGLVDRLGGFTDAVALAKARAGLGEDDLARVIQLPTVEGNFVLRLLGLASVTAPRTSGLELVPGLGQVLQLVPASLWLQPGVPQARLPYEIVWE